VVLTTPRQTNYQIKRALLTTDFEGGRHPRRIEKIKRMEVESRST
jgi:ribose 5-phosphate isomerase RpiB